LVEPPRDLTLPDAGSTTTRRVLGQHLKITLSHMLELPLGRFRSQIFDDFADVRGIVERLLREKKAGLVFSILRRPTHSTLVHCLHAELWGGGDVRHLDEWLTELTALWAFELAAAGELPPDGLRPRHRPERLLSIAANLELAVEPRWRIGLRPRTLVLEHDSERVELDFDELESGNGSLPDGVEISRPYHTIDNGLKLACADNNPLAAFEAHPDKAGNELDLDGKPPEEWTRSLAGALELVDQHLPELGREIRLVMQTLVPVGFDAERHLSASYAEAIGTAYLSLHPDPMTMAEALVHEFSHNKLNALWGLDRVLINAFSPLYSSPVRPDPRPLHGVMLAVHAFVPVARLYETMLEAGHELSKRSGFEERFRQIAQGNHEGISTLLENADPTPVGRAVLDELERWDRHFAGVRG
jgi:HEXXH motif-containing protein